MHHLLRFLDCSPVFPMFGPGTNLWQPVYHEDCARGVLKALVRSAAVGQSYDLPGAEPLACRDLIRTAAEALGRRPPIVPVPRRDGFDDARSCDGLLYPRPEACCLSPGGPASLQAQVGEITPDGERDHDDQEVHEG